MVLPPLYLIMLLVVPSVCAVQQAYLSYTYNAVRLRCVKYVQNLRGLCYKTVA